MTQIIAEIAMSLILCQMRGQEKNDHAGVQSHFVPCSFLFLGQANAESKKQNGHYSFFVLCYVSFTEYPPEN